MYPSIATELSLSGDFGIFDIGAAPILSREGSVEEVEEALEFVAGHTHQSSESLDGQISVPFRYLISLEEERFEVETEVETEVELWPVAAGHTHDLLFVFAAA